MEQEQVVKVVSQEWDGDDVGNEWQVHYVLYRTRDDDGAECFDLYSDDGEGNGDMVTRGYNHAAMRSLTLKLGHFLEWGKCDAFGFPPSTRSAAVEFDDSPEGMFGDSLRNHPYA